MRQPILIDFVHMKDVSWNYIISDHLNGQIFAIIGIFPYCSMGKEALPTVCVNALDRSFSCMHKIQNIKGKLWSNVFTQTVNLRKDPYFFIVNPFQPKSCIKKWANNPQYRDPSLDEFGRVWANDVHLVSSCVA